jgi:hypothetical protein
VLVWLCQVTTSGDTWRNRGLRGTSLTRLRRCAHGVLSDPEVRLHWLILFTFTDECSCECGRGIVVTSSAVNQSLAGMPAIPLAAVCYFQRVRDYTEFHAHPGRPKHGDALVVRSEWSLKCCSDSVRAFTVEGTSVCPGWVAHLHQPRLNAVINNARFSMRAVLVNKLLTMIGVIRLGVHWRGNLSRMHYNLTWYLSQSQNQSHL